MELSHVGATCSLSSCRTRDFLPFTCSGCNSVFCSSHRRPEQHACLSSSSSSQAHASTASCPLCGAVVVAGKNESLDVAVSRHVDQGCPKLEVSRCAVAACTRYKDDVLRMRCEDCKKITCVHHRFKGSRFPPRLFFKRFLSFRAPDLHNCSSVKAQPPPVATASAVVAPSAATRVGNRVRALMAVLHSKNKGKKSSAMVMRQQALGDASLPAERRWHAEVHFGLGSEGRLVFVNCNFSIGKAIDVLAALGKMENNNDKKGASKLCLFDLATGTALSNLTLLRDLPNGKMVLLLDTESSVFE